MRIEWREDSAHAVLSRLEQIRQEMAMYMLQARQIEDALKEADPDGTNKRLKAIDARFGSMAIELKKLAEDTEQLQDATNRMINLFESSESEALRLLMNLDPGKESGDDTGRVWAERGTERLTASEVVLPSSIPTPRIAPEMRFSALGPTMDWLMDLVDHT